MGLIQHGKCVVVKWWRSSQSHLFVLPAIFFHFLLFGKWTVVQISYFSLSIFFFLFCFKKKVREGWRRPLDGENCKKKFKFS
jgi:hypothetical protein